MFFLVFLVTVIILAINGRRRTVSVSISGLRLLCFIAFLMVALVILPTRVLQSKRSA